MRLLTLALLLALSLPTLAAAQSNRRPSEETERLVEEHPSTPQHADIATPEQELLDSANGVCYTMRSYIFERRAVEAPRLLGMVTCTPSSERQFKRATPTPKARLIPAR